MSNGDLTWQQQIAHKIYHLWILEEKSDDKTQQQETLLETLRENKPKPRVCHRSPRSWDSKNYWDVSEYYDEGKEKQIHLP